MPHSVVTHKPSGKPVRAPRPPRVRAPRPAPHKVTAPTVQQAAQGPAEQRAVTGNQRLARNPNLQRALRRVLHARAAGGMPKNFSPEDASTLVRSVGGSRKEAQDLSTKVVGESGGNPKAVGHDPGGSTGLGLFQITTGPGPEWASARERIKRLGGKGAMLKPRPNAKAALDLYRGSSNPMGNWYAGSNAPGSGSKTHFASKKPPRGAVKKLRKAHVPIPGQKVRPTKEPAAPKSSPQQAARKFKGHYVNPYKGSDPTEIDQGVDYAANADVPVAGNAIIKDVKTASGWPGGGWIAYELTDGPRKGWTAYVAEHVSPRSGLRVGQRVKKGQIIGHMTSDSIETGWAADPKTSYVSEQTLAQKHYGGAIPDSVRHAGDVSDPHSGMPEGQDFLRFLAGKPGINYSSKGGITFSDSGSAGAGTGGAARYAAATGTTVEKAKAMTPQQRVTAAIKAHQQALAKLHKVFPGTGATSAKVEGATSIGALSRRHGSPVV